MIDLLTIEKLIHQNWYKIVRESNVGENKINLNGIFKALSIDEKDDQNFISKNLHFVQFLKRSSDDVFEFQKIKSFTERPFERYDEDDDIFIPNKSKSPILLLSLNIPFVENLPKINEKNTIFLLEKESKVCDQCYLFNKKTEFCSFRSIPRKGFYPSCRYIFRLYRKR